MARARISKTVLGRGLLASASVGALFLACAQPAMAGAFLLREQSAAAIGLSTAGAAAGGAGLGSMFWNGATITDYAGWQSSWSITGIMPDSRITAQPGSTLFGATPFGVSRTTGDIAQDAVLPASYSSYQVNDKIWLGLAINTPFGLTTQAPNSWDGSTQGITAKVASYDINPTIAYKINEALSISAGVQVEYFKSYFRSATSLPVPGFGGVFTDASVKGNGWGYGFTLGATYKPVDGTEIGIGYRSAVREKTKGTLTATAPVPAGAAGLFPVRLNLDLPDMVTIGLRQRITPSFTMLAGFEWDHWNSIQALNITSPGGVLYESIPTRYKNGWLASLGGEYAWSQALTVRGGVAYEKSPIDNSNRLAILPDSDRIWTSVGVGYKLTNKLSADLSYAHLFAKNGSIDQTINGVRLVANTKSHVDIISVGLTYRFDDPPPPAREATLVRKY